MIPPRITAPIKLAALFLAITATTHAFAQEPISIPGLSMPVAASVQQDDPARTKVQHVGQGGQSAAPTEPSKRLVLVENSGSEIPAVPAGVVPRPAPRPGKPVETRQDVVVASGTNTLIPISKSQINRLVTPFENPNIQTVSSAEISTSGNVIYVTTENDQPVTMFVTPEDDESVAISLTLLPQSIPPIQANLIFAQSVPGVAGGIPALGGQAYSGTARKWERSQPYMDTLRSLMRELAMGSLPRGYSFGVLQHGDSIPACAQPAITYDFSKSQLIQGHDFRVYVAVAENISAKTVEFDHGACTHPHRAAVSSWPHEMLEPGQKTEVFVITRVPKVVAETSVRPSLLD
ncbi:MAG: type-F conjugative transfer system secretin TraK [Pseudomonas sp.]|nr:type-F conjugative transfer system secretin TraK [Pseudomonas sp.]